MKRLAFLFVFLYLAASICPVYARSPFSARHSGLDAPGENRRITGMPSRPLARTPDGGRGYTDAYGNPVSGENVDDSSRKNRIRRPPAIHSEKKEAQTLPDPELSSKSPLWKFQ